MLLSLTVVIDTQLIHVLNHHSVSFKYIPLVMVNYTSITRGGKSIPWESCRLFQCNSLFKYMKGSIMLFLLYPTLTSIINWKVERSIHQMNNNLLEAIKNAPLIIKAHRILLELYTHKKPPSQLEKWKIWSWVLRTKVQGTQYEGRKRLKVSVLGSLATFTPAEWARWISSSTFLPILISCKIQTSSYIITN